MTGPLHARVLVVTSVHEPRDARIVARQLRALVDAGFDVTYAAPFAERGVAPPCGVTAVELPRASGRRRLASLRAVRALLRSEGRRYGVVLLHDPELLLATVGLTDDVPVVWDVHEDPAAAILERTYLARPVRHLASTVLRLVERWAERHVRLILAEDAYQARFRRAHPVIHNVPMLPERVRPPVDPRVVYLGRLSHLRGADDLVAVASRLAGVGVDVELVGWADADVRPQLITAADRGIVTWQGADGFVDNEVALARVDGALAGLSLLHDVPNYRVSMPTKVLEYAAYGTPVVTTPLPLARAFVEQHDCGIVVPFGDPDAVAAAVRRLHDDPATARAMGERGRAAVRDEHSWQREAAVFVGLLREWAADGRR